MSRLFEPTNDVEQAIIVFMNDGIIHLETRTSDNVQDNVIKNVGELKMQEHKKTEILLNHLS